MKRGLVVVVGLLLSIGGCRALVGIDDLDFTPPLPDGGRGQREGGGGPGENEGGGGPGPTAMPDAALAESCRSQGQECRKCCKNASSVLHDTFEGSSKPGAQCVCDKGNCASHCMVDGKCTPGPLPSSTPGTPDDCVLCVDQVLGSAAGVCTDACNGNPDCLAAVKCLQTCPSP